MTSGFERLLTPQGEKDLYDGVSTCSRCGYCEQACPTYVATGKETHNPRGRNQLFRMILEGKLKEPAMAEEAFATCLLCGACSSACYAGVQTAEYVLEGRRRAREGAAPAALRLAVWLMDRRPRLFAWLLRCANLLKRLGLARLACLLRLPSLVGLGGLELAERHVREAPLRFLRERLPELGLRGDAWRYFPACGPDWLYPRVGLATVAAARALLGEGRAMAGLCCGLLSYNYGELETARAQARRVIERSEEGPDAPVLVDCSSCAAHLKGYEQLFLDEPDWRARARAFAGKVRDALDVLPEAARKAGLEAKGKGKATWHDSCRARHGQGLGEGPRRLLREVLGDRFKELAEADACCGGAGAFAFVQPELSEAVGRRKAERVRETGARTVLTSSTSCLIQLDARLRDCYPGTKVQHLSEFIAEHLPGPSRKKGA